MSTRRPAAASPTPSSTARADRVAHVLTERGLVKGDRVAVLLPNCHQFVEVFYGAARAGSSSCRSTGGWSPTSWRSS